ncbi:MAG: arsenate reductase family protein [Elusimicrobia bacterium]|nr:arsenate reductase family protein [Elusimicrobiota bacterium]
MTIKIYEYSKCSTCRKALKFLDARKIAYRKLPIADQPPTIAELSLMLRHMNNELKRLFNTSGELYRELRMSEKLKTLAPDAAIALLSKHGKLVKRPFVLTPNAGLVGFREDEWRRVFG